MAENQVKNTYEWESSQRFDGSMRPPRFDLPGIWEPAGDTPGKADPVLPRDGEAPIGAWNQLWDFDPDLFADELI